MVTAKSLRQFPTKTETEKKYPWNVEVKRLLSHSFLVGACKRGWRNKLWRNPFRSWKVKAKKASWKANCVVIFHTARIDKPQSNSNSTELKEASESITARNFNYRSIYGGSERENEKKNLRQLLIGHFPILEGLFSCDCPILTYSFGCALWTQQ